MGSRRIRGADVTISRSVRCSSWAASLSCPPACLAVGSFLPSSRANRTHSDRMRARHTRTRRPKRTRSSRSGLLTLRRGAEKCSRGAALERWPPPRTPRAFWSRATTTRLPDSRSLLSCSNPFPSNWRWRAAPVSGSLRVLHRASHSWGGFFFSFLFFLLQYVFGTVLTLHYPRQARKDSSRFLFTCITQQRLLIDLKI